MSKISERIAADVLKASGSGLQNYTMNGSRERIIAPASVADDLLEALRAVQGHLLNAVIGLETGCTKKTAIATLDGGIAIARAAIAKALGEQA